MNGEGREVDVAIVGTGFSGLGAAIQLKRDGVRDFVVLERADDVGGTWRDNHYPGLACDIPSHVYSFSFELSRDWTRGFAPGREIHEYLREAARKHGVMPHIRFGCEVLGATWDDSASRWRIDTARGPLTARVLVSGAGPLAEPQVPEIPGLETFQGKSFHSARWDHDHDLSGRRVAAIGTGASAIQFVPQIQRDVERLFVFQRTPPWVLPRLDHEITALEHRLLRVVPFAPQLVRGLLYAAMEVRLIGFRRPWVMRLADRVARWHLRRQVPDRELRAKLTPGYVMGCKRILISDDYYPALAQPNAEVITDGVREIRPGSIVAGDGREVDVDTIIFGTGFHVTDPQVANRIRGRDGTRLAEVWDPSMGAYKGTTVAGFPNLFILLGPNTGLGHNSQIHIIESQLNYLVDALRVMRARGAGTAEVREEAQRAYNERIQAAFDGTVWTAGHCQSWYLDRAGRNTTLWPGWTWRFRMQTRRFDPDAYELRA